MTQILQSSVLSCFSRLLGGVLFIFHNNCVPYSPLHTLLSLGRGEEPQALVEAACGSSGSGLYKKDKHIITPGATFALPGKRHMFLGHILLVSSFLKNKCQNHGISCFLPNMKHKKAEVLKQCTLHTSVNWYLSCPARKNLILWPLSTVFNFDINMCSPHVSFFSP